MTACVYRLLNSKTGKSYVGSAVDARRRRNQHLWRLRAGSHASPKLQRSFLKHGERVFVFEVLEQVLNVNRLIEREQFWIDRLDAHKGGYNTQPIAGRTRLGSKASPATLRKMSESMIRRYQDTRVKQAHIEMMRRRPPVSVATRKRLSEATTRVWQERHNVL